MRRHASNRSIFGSSLVEFALAIPFIMLFLVGVIDLSRYIAIRAILTRSAQAGLEVAVRIKDLDIEIFQPTGTDWTKFTGALNTVRTTSARLATGTFLDPSSSGSGYAQLKATSLKVGTNRFSAPASDVLVLRPGDLGAFGALVVNYVPLPVGKTFAQALRSEPIVVELRAEVRLFTPMMGTIEVIGRASGYREMPPTKLKELGDSSSIGCGNGTTEAGLGEQCDGQPNCSPDCRLLVCGDGVEVRPAEICDPSDYNVNPGAWFKLCYPPGHPQQCRGIGSTRQACSSDPTYDPTNPTPTGACCGDGVRQPQEFCETTNPANCTNGACANCDPNSCTYTCSGGTCPPGYAMRYVNGSGCQCVQTGSVIN